MYAYQHYHSLNNMKKILQSTLLIAIIALFISACSSTKNATTGTANASRGKFVGTWTVTNITYEGILQSAVTNVFDQAAPSAFVGSTWKLTNSGNGIYTLTNGTSQTIFWSVANDASGQVFQFKKIYEGDKANDGSTMVLRTPVSLGSGTGYVVYSFAKQ
jgi:PBP1b-binding outer membrane lipoprotein LpoB